MLRCKFGIHQWTKWAETTLAMRPIPYDRAADYEAKGQRRTCSRCGVARVRRVSC